MVKNISKIVFLTIFCLHNHSILAQELTDQASTLKSAVKSLPPSSQNPHQTQPWDIVWANRIAKLSYGAAFVAHVWNLGQWYKGAPASSKDKVWSLAASTQDQAQGLEGHINQTKSTLQSQFPNQSMYFDPITWRALGDQPFTLWKQSDTATAIDSADGLISIIACVWQNGRFWQLKLEPALLTETKGAILLQGVGTVLGAALHTYFHTKYNSTIAAYMDLAIIPGLFSIATYSTPLVKALTGVGALAQAYGMYRERQVQQQG